MSRGIIVHKSRNLNGTIKIQGAKNAVLPELAACLMINGVCKITNVPNISDVENMIQLLESLGCRVHRQKDLISIDSTKASGYKIPEMLGQKTRSSFFMLGPILTRFGEADFTYPGGCSIGMRPIDIHIKGLRALGAEVVEESGRIRCKSNGLYGCRINLDYPSVGATENIMMAAVFAEGLTIITNAAQEPEIFDLQKFLNKAGAKINGAGSARIEIEGVKKLKGLSYKVMSDRIETGTYMVFCAMCGGKVLLQGVQADTIIPVISKLREMGCAIVVDENQLTIESTGKLLSPKRIDTQPYPGFPTDLQALFMSAVSVAKGITLITENVFENRYNHAWELNKMGADISLRSRIAVVQGVEMIYGTQVAAGDLRAGAALVAAGLFAEGETKITGIEHIKRGYEGMIRKLSSLGANIYEYEKQR